MKREGPPRTVEAKTLTNGSKILITGPLCVANKMGMGGFKKLDFWEAAGPAPATVSGVDKTDVVRLHAHLTEIVGVPLDEDWPDEGLKKGEKYPQLRKGEVLKFIVTPETLIPVQ